MNEYFDIAQTYGGTVVNMSTYTDNYVNPLEMDVWSLDPNDSKGMIREKGEFMLGLCEQCIGDSLNSRQKSIIDRCVRKMYIDIARGREKYIPVMSDFYDILMEQPEDEAKDIALSLELFVNGSLNIFNHVLVQHNYKMSNPAFRRAASTTCSTSTEVVTLPTPPGTGVIASTTGSASAKFTSPQSLPSSFTLIPTSMTV